MTREQEKYLPQALGQIRKITGRSTLDEGQTIAGPYIFCFRKDGKAWIPIDAERVSKK
jgi:hypothetical protein